MTVTVEDAKVQLGDLIAKAMQGEPVIITKNEMPVAQLVPASEPKPKPQFGNCRDMLKILVEDDEHLKDFEEYMPIVNADSAFDAYGMQRLS